MRKLYIAYGSNLHKEQMAFRCPGAKVKYTGIVENYALVYRGSKTGAYATIIPCEGEHVPVAVWEINEDHELSLDIYEGFPRFYHKEDLEVTLNNGRKIKAMAYIMFKEAKPGYPSMRYLETCSQGYLDCGLDMTKFEESMIRNRDEVRQEAYRSYHKAHI
jgi:hypothetical protein